MSAAAFVLAINLCVAGIFATAFGVLAAYARSSFGARWLAAAYGLGIVDTALEFILPLQTDPRPVGFGIFASFLFALSLSVIGLARHYRVTPPWRVLGAIVAISLVVNLVIIDMPRSSMLRAMLYQLPYFAIQVLACWVIMRASRRQALDVMLLVLSAVSSLHFLVKPALAAALGSGASPQAYLGSTYAAISQATGSVLLVAIGLLVLLIFVRDAMAEMTARSETDTLSGLLNRRGFEDRANRLLATALREGRPAAIVVADLDHFKAINDSQGHEAGDRVIAGFAQALAALADPRAIVGRIGGEEFAVLIPGVSLDSGRLYAEAVRSGLADIAAANLGRRQISASFGVAELKPDEGLSDLLRRADAALYQAKKNGRDRVCVTETADGSATMHERRRGSRRPLGAESDGT